MKALLPKPGDVVAGKYCIEKVAGEGGMGVVFAAHHLVLDRRVALKVLVVDAARRDEFNERFVREAQAAARLQSEHVVRVMDAGSLDGELPFFVMEHLEGRDLAETLLTEGPLPVTDLADYALQVLAALSQAHAAGIIHRDLKPANLFLATVDDGRKIIKVLDFGISKQASERAQWKQLTGQTILGTPAYMSPEQLRSSKNVDEGADIWSLGVSLYELATGALPFDGEDSGELFAAILEQTPTPARAYRPDLPQAFEDILRCCLQRDREARFIDVRAMAEALMPLGSGKWSHLLDGIERSLACSKRFVVSNVALVDAARAAASLTIPPPSPSSRSLAVLSGDVRFTVTGGETPALAVPRMPTMDPKRTLRSRIALGVAVAAVPLLLLASFLAPRGSLAAALGASSPVPMVNVAPPSRAETLPEVAPPPVAEVPSSTPTPKDEPEVTTEPSPAPRVSNATKGAAVALKRSKGRPSFLKSRD